MKEIAPKLDAIDPGFLAERLLEFVNVESPTGSEDSASRFFAGYLKEIGLEVMTFEAAPGRRNVLGRLPGNGRGPNVVFNGHLDTVPPHRCIGPAIREGKVWGRGSEDMKGGLVAAAEAVRWLKNSGVRLKGDVYIMAVVGHETPVGKKEGPIYFKNQIKAGQIKPDAIIILEGPQKLWVASLGYAAIRFWIPSRFPSAHTFTIPVQENPIFIAGNIVAALNATNDQLAREEAHPLCGHGFVQLGMVQGGDYVTRVPNEVVLAGTFSWTSQWNAEAVKRKLENILDEAVGRSGLKATVEMEAVREPFETSSSERIVTAIQEAARQLTGSPSQIIGSALVSDAHFYRNDCGVPTVYYGPAYRTAHSDTECLSITDLTHLTKLCVLSAIEFCETV